VVAAGSPKRKAMLRIGRSSDTSPLTGLAYANAAFANVNVFATNAASYGGTETGIGTKYLTQDALGSTRVVMAADQSYTVHDYYPFGVGIDADVRNQRSSLAAYGNESGLVLKFTGKERDAETGLDYFGARYMSSAQGRFRNSGE
jgi:RHS repeat-associated protein